MVEHEPAQLTITQENDGAAVLHPGTPWGVCLTPDPTLGQAPSGRIQQLLGRDGEEKIELGPELRHLLVGCQEPIPGRWWEA